MKSQWIDKLGGTKAALAMVVIAGCFAGVCFGKLTFEQVEELVKWTLTVYIAGNVANTLGTAGVPKKPAEPVAEPPKP